MSKGIYGEGGNLFLIFGPLEHIYLPGWDNNGEPGNQVPTKSLYSTKILHGSPSFSKTM